MLEFIPVANPRAQYIAYRDEIQAAIERVLEGGHYILGEEEKQFEEEFAAFLGVQHCVGVANGTDAIAIALQAVGVAPGDEVITVSHSAVATTAAIEQVGARPVFADIDPLTRCIDPLKIPPLISSKTKALLPVHIYGQPAPMQEIMEIARRNSLKVIEDCAQAHAAEIEGKKVGSFGNAATFSFYPTKNLGAIGDGGAMVTNEPDVIAKARLLGQYGWKERYISSIAGMNSRLDELQAAILRVKLRYLTENNVRRREIARDYYNAIQEDRIIPPGKIAGTTHAMHLFVIESEERSELQSFLNGYGIGTAIHYPLAIHQQPAYQNRIRGGENLPQTERLYPRILSLPMYPELTGEQIARVCSALKEWSSKK